MHACMCEHSGVCVCVCVCALTGPGVIVCVCVCVCVCVALTCVVCVTGCIIALNDGYVCVLFVRACKHSLCFLV